MGATRTLYLTRHADAGAHTAVAMDFMRRISELGLRQIDEIGKRLKERKISPDLIVSSEAYRALETARGLAPFIGYDSEKVVTHPDIYQSNPRTLLDIINQIDDKIQQFMLVGHNPTISHLVSYLSQRPLESVSTCTVTCISMEIERWSFAGLGTGLIDWQETPQTT